MKNKRMTLLLLIILVFCGCSSGCGETPDRSSALKSEAVEDSSRVETETGTADNSIKDRSNNEEESVAETPESAEQPNMDLCSGHETLSMI